MSVVTARLFAMNELELGRRSDHVRTVGLAVAGLATAALVVQNPQLAAKVVQQVTLLVVLAVLVLGLQAAMAR